MSPDLRGKKYLAIVVLTLGIHGIITACASTDHADKNVVPVAELPEVPFDERFDAYLHKETGSIGENAIERTVLVDAFVDRHIVFFAAGTHAAPALVITDPDRQRVDPASSNLVSLRQSDRAAAIRIRAPRAGAWSIRILPPTDGKKQSYVFAVTGQGTRNLFIHANLKIEKEPESCLIITCMFSGTGGGVKGVRVSGRLLRPDGKEEPFSLFDDGDARHGDAYEADGVYTNRLSGVEARGLYRVCLRAVCEKGMTVVPGDSPDFVGDTSEESQPVPAFNRYACEAIAVE